MQAQSFLVLVYLITLEFILYILNIMLDFRTYLKPMQNVACAECWYFVLSRKRPFYVQATTSHPHCVCCAFNVIVVKSLFSDFQIYHLCALPRAFWCLAVVSFSLFLKVFGMQNKIRSPCTHSSDLIPGFHKLFYRLSVLSTSLFLTSPVISSSLGLLFSDLWTDIWDLVTSPYWALPFLCLCSFSCGGESEIKKNQWAWSQVLGTRSPLIRRGTSCTLGSTLQYES